MEDVEIVVPNDKVHNFIVSSLEAVGLTPARGSLVADVLVSADYRGIYSHGVILLDKYMDEIRSGAVSAEDKEPTVIKESIGTAMVDGNSLIGAYVARYCMDISIRKAKEAGIGFVTCRCANHFGMAGWYSMYAMEQGFVGIALCNTNPRMVPTRGTKPTLGTNPVSIAAPGNHGDNFVLDMATTVVAAGKLKIMASKDSNLPANMIVDVNGHESHKYEDFNGMFPVGGREETGGYKGFGLAMMVDILSGVLSGAEFGANCKGAGNLGLGFIAIDPNQFEDGFTNRMQSLIDDCRNQPAADVGRQVLVPGDPERQHMELCDKLGGIPYTKNHLQTIEHSSLHLLNLSNYFVHLYAQGSKTRWASGKNAISEIIT